MPGHFSNKVFEVVIESKVIGFCGFNKAVDDCAGRGSFWRIHCYPVLASKSEWSYCLFCTAIVHRNVSVRKKDAKVAFLIYPVGQTSGCGTAGRESDDNLFCPLKEIVNFWLQNQLPLFLTSSFAEILPLIIEMEYIRYFL